MKKIVHVFEITGLIHGRPLVKLVEGSQPFKQNQYLAVYQEESGKRVNGQTKALQKVEEVGFNEAVRYMQVSALTCSNLQA
ncbi:MAG: hypothetical protein WCH05_10120 [Chlorobiaceae bacterium]